MTGAIHTLRALDFAVAALENLHGTAHNTEHHGVAAKCQCQFGETLRELAKLRATWAWKASSQGTTRLHLATKELP
jgi:hypothetical protein